MSISPIKYVSLMKYHLDYVPEIFKQYSKMFTWKKNENLRIVDIGSGPGHLLAKVEPLFPRQYKEIMGLDKAVDMVNYMNAIPKDPRISARQLDIETVELPDDLKNRFDFAFSCLCFQYVKDVSKAFKNSSLLLKSNGESLFVWCKRCHIYDVYNSLSKVEKWSTYTSDFKSSKNYFDNENSLNKVQREFDKVGLKILKSEELNDIYFEEERAECFFDLLNSIDAISGRIPKYDLEKYREDFNKALSSQIIVENTETGPKHKLYFPTLIVASKKM